MRAFTGRVAIVVLVLFTVLFTSHVAWGQPTVRLRVVNVADVSDGLESMLARELPDVKVEITYQSRPDFRGLQGAVDDGAFDVLVSANLAILARDDYLLPLDYYIQRHRLHHPLYDSMRLDGVLYDLPIYLDPVVVAYNRTIFDAHGLAYPQAGWTWDEFVEIATKTSNPMAQTPQYGAMLPVSSLWSTIVRRHADPVVVGDDELLHYSLTVVGRLLTGSALVGHSYGGSNDFLRGNVAMMETSLTLALLSQLRGGVSPGVEIGVVPLPAVPGRTGHGNIQVAFTAAIAATTRVPDLAWQVAYAISTHGYDIFASLYDIPASGSAAELEAWVDRALPPASGPIRHDVRDLLQQPMVFEERVGSSLYGVLSAQQELYVNGAVGFEEALTAARAHRDEL